MSITLYPPQVTIVDKAMEFLKKRRHVYNASEMGTGKSIMTAEMIRRLREAEGDKRVIIVCPSVMRPTWKRELIKCGTFSDSEILVITKGSEIPEGDTHKAYIISYTMMPRPDWFEMYKTIGTDAIIVFDEAHKLKDWKTKQWKASRSWISVAAYRIYLSGTPMINCTLDVYNTLSACHPIKYTVFAHTYAQVKQTPWGPKFFGARNTPQLKALLYDTFMVRMRLKQLKTLTGYIDKEVVLPQSCGAKLTDAEITEIEREILSSKKSTHVSHLRERIGVSKVKEVAEYTEDLVEQGLSTILFVHHKNVADAYKDRLQGCNPCVIMGATRSDEREKAIKDFQEGKTKLIIMSIQAGGVGITLTKASQVVFAEYPWTYAEVTQAIARAHRVGQENQVIVHTFRAEGGIDSLIFRLVREKETMHQATINVK